MIDRVTATVRSYIMSSVRSKNTNPELKVRSLAHAMGYRFRLHRSDLPGKPDLVFPSRKSVVFVHGCFWHGHECKRTKMPKSNVDFWNEKICRNQARDMEAQAALTALGWRSLVIWECEAKSSEVLKAELTKFLGPPSQAKSQK